MRKGRQFLSSRTPGSRRGRPTKHAIAHVSIINELVVAQGGKCAICGGAYEYGRDGLHLDHCHESMQVRGLLCRPCNLAITAIDGKAPAEALAWMEAAARYLRSGGPARALVPKDG